MCGPKAMTETSATLGAMLDARLDEIATESRAICAVLAQPVVPSAARVAQACAKIGHVHRELSHSLMRLEVPPQAANDPDWIALRARIATLRGHLALWPSVEQLIYRQAPSSPIPLERPSTPETALADAQMGLMEDLIADLGPMLEAPSQSAEAHGHGCFGDIALPHGRFTSDIHIAYRLRLAMAPDAPTQFLDIGCGSGMKVLAAARVFEMAHGLEFDAGFAAAAERAFARARRSNLRVTQGDALVFEDYARYDVLYFFQPMREPERLAMLEDRIAASVRPGTVLIAPYRQFNLRHEALGCTQVAGSVYLAGLGLDAAERAIEHALHIGPYVAQRQNVRLGPWSEIVAASHKNGWALNPL